MLVGYIRVSTDDQNLNLQKDALIKYGIDQRNIFSDKTSGSGADIAFGDGKDVICEFTWTRVGAANEQSGFGFSTTTAPFSTYEHTGAVG